MCDPRSDVEKGLIAELNGDPGNVYRMMGTKGMVSLREVVRCLGEKTRGPLHYGLTNRLMGRVGVLRVWTTKSLFRWFQHEECVPSRPLMRCGVLRNIGEIYPEDR